MALTGFSARLYQTLKAVSIPERATDLMSMSPAGHCTRATENLPQEIATYGIEGQHQSALSLIPSKRWMLARAGHKDWFRDRSNLSYIYRFVSLAQQSGLLGEPSVTNEALDNWPHANGTLWVVKGVPGTYCRKSHCEKPILVILQGCFCSKTLLPYNHFADRKN
ncbi:LOW QUALITY PROTEIN: hypothetical protein IFM47457_05475 [Aspergillus lentulus]|nr:LOW QUALITY PROTEIN: hypothetical protein IFM47457_05475 [Aspergillus lentulus]